jgi:hypothetical protein
MKRLILLSFLLLVPLISYAQSPHFQPFENQNFEKALREAYQRLNSYRGEWTFHRRVMPTIPQARRQNEDFNIMNMNLTILPELGNTTEESRVTINTQVMIRVTGTDPLSSAMFYSKTYDRITVSSPDTELTYTVGPYSYDENISIINVVFKNPLPRDSIVRINITTEGKPNCKPSPFLGLVTCQYNKTLTYDLSVMHPMRADGKDEAFSFDIAILIPDDYFSTASGSFAGSVENGDGTKTELWHNDLAQFVAYGLAKFDRFYSEYEGDNNRVFPINSFVLPERGEKAKGFHTVVGKALNWYSKKFYPYQYPVISFNEIDRSSDAAYATPMAQFMPAYLIDAGSDSREAIETFAHEVAHQWWGFMVMSANYEYPWIDEGFAEFSAMEFATQNNELARAFMYGVYAFLYFYMVSPDEDVPIRSFDVFSDDIRYVILTYYKGALVLAQLANIMGDDFYKVLSFYVSKNLFQFTDVERLKSAFKDVTGDDYAWYLDRWLNEAGYPIYTLKYDIKTTGDKSTVDVYIQQASSTYKAPGINVLFDMPVDIAFYNDSREEVQRVTERIDKETFEKTYEFDGHMQSVIVDPAIKIYMKRLRSAQKGDINLDMEVDGLDVLLTAYSYNYNWYSYFEKENARFLPNADINMNGVVDDEDLNAVVENFGECILSSCK